MLFRKHKAPKTPIIEHLLQGIYADLDKLSTLRARVASSGVDRDRLPDDLILRAFAMLGDHQRDALVASVLPHVGLLLDKGLLENADVDQLSTPVVRFLAHIEHLFDEMLNVSQRIAVGIDNRRNGISMLGAPVIRCAAKASAYYGQEMRIKMHVSGAEWLLVRPDSVFGFAESLQAVPLDCPATIPLPCDDGDVLIAAMSSSGAVTVHTIRISTTMEEML